MHFEECASHAEVRVRLEHNKAVVNREGKNARKAP